MHHKTKITSWLTGLDIIRTYRREWFGSDFVAGLSIAAVALPIGIAYSAYTLKLLRAELAEQGIVLGIARARGLFRMMLDRSGLAESIGSQNLFHTVHAGAESFLRDGSQPATR